MGEPISPQTKKHNVKRREGGEKKAGSKARRIRNGETRAAPPNCADTPTMLATDYREVSWFSLATVPSMFPISACQFAHRKLGEKPQGRNETWTREKEGQGDLERTVAIISTQGS